MAKQDLALALFYDGVWNEHAAAVLTRDGVEITHGRDDESGQPTPTTVVFSFTGWDFNPRNPSSPLFGKIGRNTPLRITRPTLTRFVGEVASWTPRQSLGGPNTPPDRWVEVVAAGVSRRLGQGADLLEDVLLRWAQQQSSATRRGYWPLSDPVGSINARSGVGGSSMRLFKSSTFSLVPQYGVGALAPWLPPTVRLGPEVGNAGALDGFPSTVPAGGWAIDFLMRANQTTNPDSTWVGIRIALGTQFSARDWQLNLQPAGTPAIGVEGPNANAEAFDHDLLWDSAPHHIRLEVSEESGDNASWDFYVDGERVTGFTWDIGTAAVPEVRWVTLEWIASTVSVPPALEPVDVGQLIVWASGAPPIVEAADVFAGRTGETAGRRIERLCDEEGVPFVADPFDADLDDTQPAGPQYPDGLLTLLREAADLDHGILLDNPVVLNRALTYRTGRSLYNQPPTLSGLDYAAGQVAPPLDPVLDDQATRNDITVQRRDGDSVRVTLDAGPMSTETPPDGVGRVQESVTVNTMGDGLLGDQAGWRLHLGTTDEVRFPQVSIDVDANPELETLASVLRPGDRLTITNLPPELSPDPVSLLVQGYTETIGSHRRRLVFNCTPEEPFHIAEVEHLDYSIIGSGGAATVGEDLTTTETDVSLFLGAGPDWVHEADFDILVAGERMTVTAVGAATGTFPSRIQTLTVVRSVNGVVKEHTVPQPTVDVFHKSYIGL